MIMGGSLLALQMGPWICRIRELEVDGRWIAEVVALAGCMACARTREETVSRVQALALRVIADRLEHGEGDPPLTGTFYKGAH